MNNNNELPDWLVEKVARAIVTAYAHNKTELTESDWPLWTNEAKAALSTISIMEMIEALGFAEVVSRLPIISDAEKLQEIRKVCGAVLDKINKLRGDYD